MFKIPTPILFQYEIDTFKNIPVNWKHIEIKYSN